jgi:hypothetical protein
MRGTRDFGYLPATLAFLLLSVRLAEPNGFLLSMGGGGGEGAHVDIFVREVKEPVTLLAPGGKFPAGREAGGIGVARNPSFPSRKESKSAR